MGEMTVGYTETLNYKCLEDLQQTISMGIMNPLNLYYCGRENCSPGWRFGPYSRRNFLIHVVTAGKGTYKVKGHVYHISAGEAFLIYPDVETVYQADQEDPWSYMWVGFNGFAAEKTLGLIGFSEERLVIRMENTDEIAKHIERIFAARQLTQVNDLKRTAAFYDVLAAMMEMNQSQKAVKYYPDIVYVKMAVDLITALYHNKIKISDIADKIGINRSYLTNIFKREMKMSPQAFLIEIRLERAAELLRDTDLPIGNIALNVGYNDALSFSKAFKHRFGVSPSEFRASSPELEITRVRGGYTRNEEL